MESRNYGSDDSLNTPIEDSEFNVVQGGVDDSQEKFNYVSELYEAKKAELLTKDERIRVLEEEVATLSQNTAKRIPFTSLVAEAKINYENLSGIGFARKIQSDFNRIDTIPVFEVRWKDEVNSSQREADKIKLTNWLKTRLQDSTLVVQSVN